MSEVSGAGFGFSYDESASTEGAEALLNLLQTYRDSEAALRARVAKDLGVGDTELLTLRYLLQAEEAGTTLRPSDLRGLLGLTTGSVTALLDRLESTGYAARSPHPTDRRSSQIVLDSASTAVVRAGLDSMQASILDVAEDLSEADRAVVVNFLRRIVDVTQHSNESKSPAE